MAFKYPTPTTEAETFSALPPTGEAGRFYVALDTNKVYRWSVSQSAYIALNAQTSSTDITNSTELGRGFITAATSSAARKLLDLSVYDAREWGVNKDGSGAPSNNVANLQECIYDVSSLGGGTIQLPSGDIATSDCDVLYGPQSNVPAVIHSDTGRAFTNYGGLLLPSNGAAPIKIVGHGSATRLKLSKAFMSAFHLRGSGNTWADIVLEGFDVDRDNIVGEDIAHDTVSGINGGVLTLAQNTFTVIPGLDPNDWRYAKMAYLEPNDDYPYGLQRLNVLVTNGQVQIGTYGIGGVNSSGTYVPSLSSITIKNGNVLRAQIYDHVVIGNYYGEYNNHFRDILIDDIGVLNVPLVHPRTPTYATPLSLIKDALLDWSPAVCIRTFPQTPGVRSQSTAKNVVVRGMRGGGTTGIFLGGLGPEGSGYWDDTWIVNCNNDTGGSPGGNFATNNYFIGAHANVGRAGVINSVGSNSGDPGIEVDNCMEFWSIDNELIDPFNAFVGFNTTAPCNSPNGPPTAQLQTALPANTTTVTVTIDALPEGVDRTGVLLVGDATGVAGTSFETMWYEAVAGSTTSLKLYRSFLGSAATVHASDVGTSKRSITFFEHRKQRYHILNTRTRYTQERMKFPSGGPIYMQSASPLPLPSLLLQNFSCDIDGGDTFDGHAINIAGWMPSLEIDGFRFRRSGYAVNPASAAQTQIRLDALESSSKTRGIPYPPTKIKIRNCDMTVHSVGAVNWLEALWLGRGYFALDVDIELEAIGSGGIHPFVIDYGPTWIAAGSRIRFTGRHPVGLDTVASPRVIDVGISTGAGAITIEDTLMLDLNLYNWGFTAGTGDTNYKPINITSNDVTNTAKVLVERIIHPSMVTKSYPASYVRGGTP